MARIVIVASFGQSLTHFRGDLIDSWLKRGHTVQAVAPDSTVAKQLEGKGVDFTCIPFERAGLNPVRDSHFIFKLIHFLYMAKPDYLFLYTPKPVIYGALAAYTQPRCRVISLITGLGYVFTEGSDRKWLKKLTCRLYKIALKRNRKVLFQNPDDLKMFNELNLVDEEKCLIVNGSGVNIENFKPAALPPGIPVFLMIARLLEEKGFKEYIEAAQLIKQKYPEIVFRLIAWPLAGSPSVITGDRVEQWQDKGIVEVFGETDDIRPYLAGASVYVLPSYREGTPRTVLEAMAMGRAIITTDAPGCRETVIDGVNGFLVPVKDSDALARAMEKYIAEPELIVKMGTASRKLAVEKYDVHKVNKVINAAMEL